MTNSTVAHIVPNLRTQHIGAELAINLGATVLVASVSDPDLWHEVGTAPFHCTCAGFFYRSTCRHLAVALAAQAPTPEPTPEPVAAPLDSPTARVAPSLWDSRDDDDYYSPERIAARRAQTPRG